MKSKFLTLTLFTSLVCGMAMLNGCASSGSGHHPLLAEIGTQTNTIFVPVIVTNTATGAVSTNQTPTQQVVPVYGVSPTLQTGLNYAGAVAPLIPAPFGTILGGVLSLATLGLGFYAKKVNGQLSTAQSVITAVVSGVEVAGDAATKIAIQSHATAAGVQDNLDPIVQTVTKNMPDIPLRTATPAPVAKAA